jgi:hypothetical protein
MNKQALLFTLLAATATAPILGSTPTSKPQSCQDLEKLISTFNPNKQDAKELKQGLKLITNCIKETKQQAVPSFLDNLSPAISKVIAEKIVNFSIGITVCLGALIYFHFNK